MYRCWLGSVSVCVSFQGVSVSASTERIFQHPLTQVNIDFLLENQIMTKQYNPNQEQKSGSKAYTS